MAMYKDTAEKIERLIELFNKALGGSISTIMVFPFIYSIFNYYILGLGKESFLLFCPAWFVLTIEDDLTFLTANRIKIIVFFSISGKRWPFDWKTPFGFLVAWLGQCAGLASDEISATLFFGIVLGSNLLFIVIAEDITNEVAEFNNIVESHKKKDRGKLLKRFCGIIQLHTDGKQ